VLFGDQGLLRWAELNLCFVERAEPFFVRNEQKPLDEDMGNAMT
jgi:hypothetical protein